MRQEDLFFSQLTVRETLSLAAELQLPEITSVEARDEYVKNLLFKLGLVRLLEDGLVGLVIFEVHCFCTYRKN